MCFYIYIWESIQICVCMVGFTDVCVCVWVCRCMCVFVWSICIYIRCFQTLIHQDNEFYLNNISIMYLLNEYNNDVITIIHCLIPKS